jgi:hypothetical protein
MISMKVVLTQDVKAQGKKGQVVEVSEGYARNFLFPKKLAIPADNAALNDIKNKEASQKYRIEEEIKAAKELAAKIEAVVVVIKTAGSADGSAGQGGLATVMAVSGAGTLSAATTDANGSVGIHNVTTVLTIHIHFLLLSL